MYFTNDRIFSGDCNFYVLGSNGHVGIVYYYPELAPAIVETILLTFSELSTLLLYLFWSVYHVRFSVIMGFLSIDGHLSDKSMFFLNNCMFLLINLQISHYR